MTKKRTAGEIDLRTILYTDFRSKGGDPSALFETLEVIIQQRAWEKLLDEQGRPVGSLRRLIEAPLPTGCGQSVRKVKALLDVEHRYESIDNDWRDRMQRLREALYQELPELGSVGRPSKDEDGKGSNTTLSESELGRGANYALARLKRDRPELAEAVIAGKMTANEAAIVAGFRKRKIQVYPDDPENTARLLLKHMGERGVDELQIWLDKVRGIGNDL